LVERHAYIGQPKFFAVLTVGAVSYHTIWESPKCAVRNRTYGSPIPLSISHTDRAGYIYAIGKVLGTFLGADNAETTDSLSDYQPRLGTISNENRTQITQKPQILSVFISVHQWLFSSQKEIHLLS
jgi:hypothetical protein